MSELVEKFLKFARPLKRFEVVKQANLSECFNKVATLVAKEHPSISFESRIEPNVIVDAPEEFIIELFDVLIRNSVAACDTVTVPKIVLSGTIKNSSLHLTLEDNGRGLTKELQADPGLAFQPFFTTKASGSGLGLALAKRIIEECRGMIKIGAASQGGAKVEMSLPRRVV